MSKGLIVGDMHFGVKANSQEYLNFQLKWIREELVDSIKKNDVEHVIFLGDVNDSRVSLSPLIMKYQRDVFLELKNMFPNVTFHVILGNHDLYYRNTREVHSLTFMSDIGYNVYENNTEVVIDDKKMIFVPWILKDEMEDFKLMLANNNYCCLFGHLEIQGFSMVKGVVDTDGWKHNIFDNCEKVFSGHYHIRSKKGSIQYTGTPYETTFNDAGSTKGIELIDFETMETKFIKSKNIPRHININSEDYPFENINKKLITNNILKVTLCDSLNEVQKIEYIEKCNSLKPFKILYEDSQDSDLKINDQEIASSIKNTEEFLQEYIGIINIEDDNIDKSEIMDLFKQYHAKVLL
jgi:DNA repair exonuclease SbcCD nuclease subunit